MNKKMNHAITLGVIALSLSACKQQPKETNTVILIKSRVTFSDTINNITFVDTNLDKKKRSPDLSLEDKSGSLSISAQRNDSIFFIVENKTAVATSLQVKKTPKKM